MLAGPLCTTILYAFHGKVNNQTKATFPKVGVIADDRKDQRESLTRAQMLPLLRQQLPELRQRYGVRAMWLFGSYVRGEQCRHSDLDVLVEFDDCPLSLLQFIALQCYLSDLLRVRVDLYARPGRAR
jgi:hypothetical protein